MKNIISPATTAQKVDLVSLIGFLEYYLPIIKYLTPTKVDLGGCGFFALQLHKVLKTMGIETEITYVSSRKYNSNIEYLKNNNAMPSDKEFGVLHAAIAINKYISIDSDGVCQPFSLLVSMDKSRETSVITDEQMQILWDNVVSWNKVFDRDCCDGLAKLIAEIPAKYEQFLEEGYFVDFSALPQSIDLTSHTVDALKEFEFQQMMGKMFSA